MLDTMTNEQIVAAAQQYYDQHLKVVLEPAHDGEFVAIDSATGRYAVSADPIVAYEDLLARGSEGSLPLHRVGASYTFEYF